MPINFFHISPFVTRFAPATTADASLDLIKSDFCVAVRLNKEINRPFAAASNNYYERETQGENVIFESFALLAPKPVS